MAKYRLKSAVVDAVQWNAAGDHPAVRSPLAHEKHVYALRNMTGRGLLQTHGGTMVVNPGDFIVTDERGISAIPAAAFNAKYELAA
ncbi:hypothetical protein JFK97_05905 [Chromobacterium phragmitis]|uniref:hypothetical protein n=1 Tax=Chromobacterium amazonense TaxID=1382803 RepID=UPI0021B80BFB|nr:hypothetical protein [Chromobacterium amazonense]MBM2883919.1 hypothetical protein [Chromobacterium amazonense]MDE1711836.1 hypothetical protein [Chromobacterium amazonense]